MSKYSRQGPRTYIAAVDDVPDAAKAMQQPRALPQNIGVFANSGETLVVDVPAQSAPTTFPSAAKVDEFCASFKRVMYTTDGISADLIGTASLGVELLMMRINAPATVPMPETPDYADTLLLPAFDSIMKSIELLNNEDPILLKGQDLGQLATARQLVAGYQSVLDILDPLQWGATARKLQALLVIAAFCQHVAKNGGSAIARNRILTKALAALTLYTQSWAAAAEATKQLKAQTSHEVEASTLARVTAANSGTTQTGNAGSAGTGTAGGHGTTSAPVPPGGTSVVLPEPVHAKPKRHAPASAPKTRTKTSGSKT